MKFTANGNQKKGNGKKSKSSKKKNNSSRSGPSKGLIVFLCILALLIGGGVFGYITVNKEITGNRGLPEKEIVLDVPAGSYGSDVAELLKAEDIIGSTRVFKAYLKVFGSGQGFTEGRHLVSSTMHYDELIEELTRTTHDDSRPTFRITFPEGTTCLKMAWMFEEVGFCTTEEFLDACNNDVFEVSFYDMISDSPNKFVKIEGFLYPDTYEFYEDSTVHEVILIMMQNFESKVMTDEMMADIEASPYTFEDAIIFGSIVQKESYGGEEFNVAGVFYNRMQPGSGFDKLESCTTNDFRWYVLWHYYGSEAATPPAMDAAYDTYKYSGFPIGAICNPSAEMIYAALHPADVPYYFFCTNVDTKEFFWAVTNEEHERNLILAGIK